MDDLQEKQSVLARRGIVYACAALEERVDRTKDPRTGEFKKFGEDVLRHKLADVAEADHYGLPNQVVQGVSYAMASLAGEPGKEILVVGSKSAASFVSWATMRYLGWTFLASGTSAKSSSRKEGLRQWHEIVIALPAATGVCFKYANLLSRLWRRGGTRNDEDMAIIQKKFAAEKWFRQHCPPEFRSVTEKS